MIDHLLRNKVGIIPAMQTKLIYNIVLRRPFRTKITAVNDPKIRPAIPVLEMAVFHVLSVPAYVHPNCSASIDPTSLLPVITKPTFIGPNVRVVTSQNRYVMLIIFSRSMIFYSMVFWKYNSYINNYNN